MIGGDGGAAAGLEFSQDSFMKSISRGGDDNEDRGGNAMISDLVNDEIFRNDNNDDENANVD